MKDQKTPSTRSVSASEIARNVRYFETWSSYHGCEQVTLLDLPETLKKDAKTVFDLTGKLPIGLVDKSSKSYTRLSKLAPDLHKFLLRAFAKMPALFSNKVAIEKQDALLAELGSVYLAWSQLTQMKRTKERWSEADFAAKVYNALRSPAVRDSSYRTQCSIHLPQHRSYPKILATTTRILKTRTVIPDGAIFVRASTIKKLSSAKTSAYKRINTHASTVNVCGLEIGHAFRYQATPCSQPPSEPCFEFASSFWEDKKPGCEMLEHAYRQNRMACAASLRHLYALRIHAPVFGLLWADGKVKAHVDWCIHDEGQIAVYSAPYTGPSASEDTEDQDEISASPILSQCSESDSDFYEWDLFNPADILSVFLLVRNLDIWTASTFRERVEKGVNALAGVVGDGRAYVPWRESAHQVRILRTSSLSNAENTSPNSVSITISKLPAKPQKKMTRSASRAACKSIL